MSASFQTQEFETRFDIFEPGDLTALVCIDQPEYQQQIVDQLSSMDYKIHVGLFAEDISLKLKTHVYDVVVIDEHFGRLLPRQQPGALRGNQPAARPAPAISSSRSSAPAS